METETTTFDTSDLYLIAYLKLQGFKYETTKHKNRFIFSFEKTDEFVSSLNLYYTENATVDPLLFSNTIKNIKNFIHNS